MDNDSSSCRIARDHEWKKMCQVVATRNLKKGEIVAAYPVVIESHENIDDTMYTIAIMKRNHSYETNSDKMFTAFCRHPDAVRADDKMTLPVCDATFHNISGIPSKKAFEHYEKKELKIPPVGLYLNEPCHNQIANCDFMFPTFKSVNPEILVGEYAEGYIRTTKQIAIGEPLTWCYGCEYDRDWPTSCSNQC